MGTDHSKFAVFILTHGRPDNVITVETLRKSGYTGRVYFIIDNEDRRGHEYRERFGPEDVIEFDKAAIGETFDTVDSLSDRRSDVYARNASFGIARDLGLDYFLQLDDDYKDFLYRWVEGDRIRATMMRSMNEVVEAMLTFLDESGAAAVAWSQGGDHMGANPNNVTVGIRRKAMNSFFLRTDRPVKFLGRLNNDVNTYITHGSRGDLFLTVMGLQLNQIMTQESAGGMTDTYRTSGTYIKSFYTVMMAPSCVGVGTMGRHNRRYHHWINWDHAVPKILNERYRKATP